MLNAGRLERAVEWTPIIAEPWRIAFSNPFVLSDLKRPFIWCCTPDHGQPVSIGCAIVNVHVRQSFVALNHCPQKQSLCFFSIGASGIWAVGFCGNPGMYCLMIVARLDTRRPRVAVASRFTRQIVWHQKSLHRNDGSYAAAFFGEAAESCKRIGAIACVGRTPREFSYERSQEMILAAPFSPRRGTMIHQRYPLA